MDTKMKADITELAVAKELLERCFNVLKPIGDRLAYDLAVDLKNTLIRIQIKAAWYNYHYSITKSGSTFGGQVNIPQHIII